MSRPCLTCPEPPECDQCGGSGEYETECRCGSTVMQTCDQCDGDGKGTPDTCPCCGNDGGSLAGNFHDDDDDHDGTCIDPDNGSDLDNG